MGELSVINKKGYILEVIISEQGKLELTRIGFEIARSIYKILKYVPKRDLSGLSHIVVTDLPSNKKSYRNKATASYFCKQRNQPAHIEIYLKNLFGHVKNAESFRHMLPIQEFSLAKTLYHEFGHHIKDTRRHGIKKEKSESFAESYAAEMMSSYILDNAKSINGCFDCLESISEAKHLSLEIISNMRAGWEHSFNQAIERKAGRRRPYLRY